MDNKFFSVFSHALLATGVRRLKSQAQLNDGVSYWVVGFMDGLRFAYDYPDLAFKSDRLMFSPEQDRFSTEAIDGLAVAIAHELRPLPALSESEYTHRLEGIATRSQLEEEVVTVPVSLLGGDLDKGKAVWEVKRMTRVLPLTDEQIDTLEMDD